jgi:molybdate transport system substrate-binding protein
MTLSCFRDHCILLGVLAAASGCAHRAARETVAIAAAADLRFALDELTKQFETAHPALAITPAYGSSGNFYAQIREGAPFDVFLSADIEYPRRLVDEKLAVADTLFTYAVGRIVVWVPAQSPLDPASLEMGVLEAPAVKHIAIANPAHAPYGRAAEAALRSLGVYGHVAGKLVLGENIGQTLEFVQSGAADVGIVALSLALAPPVRAQGKYWEIPLSAYPRIQQGGVILSRARDSRAAAAFRQFLLGPVARRTLQQYGFSGAEE